MAGPLTGALTAVRRRGRLGGRLGERHPQDPDEPEGQHGDVDPSHGPTPLPEVRCQRSDGRNRRSSCCLTTLTPDCHCPGAGYFRSFFTSFWATASLTSIPLCRLNSMSRLNTSASSSATAARVAGSRQAASGLVPGQPAERLQQLPDLAGQGHGEVLGGVERLPRRAAAKAPAAGLERPDGGRRVGHLCVRSRRSPGRVALTVFPRARPPEAEGVYNRGSGIVNEK